MLRKNCYIGKKASSFSPEEELRKSRGVGPYKAMGKFLEPPELSQLKPGDCSAQQLQQLLQCSSQQLGFLHLLASKPLGVSLAI